MLTRGRGSKIPKNLADVICDLPKSYPARSYLPKLSTPPNLALLLKN